MGEDFEKLLDDLTETYRSRTEEGKRASYIPELATVDPGLFSLAVTTAEGGQYASGDFGTPFSMQSISKVVSLAFAAETLGIGEVFRHVGMEPCAEPFNSIMKLEMTSTIPLNPFINSGAIMISSLLCQRLGGGAFDEVAAFASRLAGRPAGDSLRLNERIYRSEASTADRNRALAYFMRSTGAIETGAEEALDLYFKMCSTEADTRDLSLIGATIAGGGVNPMNGARILSVETAYVLIGLMSTCGLYNESGEFAVKVGIPAKSGVCGGILCAVPGRMGIAVFSPLLDERGNSVAGIKALTHLSRVLNLRGV